MRALKTILIILGVLLALMIVFYAIGPKHSHVSREAVIGAPVSVVWSHANSLKHNNDWSPFLEKDPTAVVTYEGEDGAVGSKSTWKGNSDVGSGEQEITAIEPEKHMAIKLSFHEPMEGLANAAMDYAGMGDSTKVTWAFDSDNGFLSRIFCVFMDMDKMLGPVFEKGLTNLKTLAEGDQQQAASDQAKMVASYTFTTTDRPAQLYYGKRETVKWADMHAFFGKNFGEAFAALGKAGLKPGVATGVYFSWDVANKQADVMAAVPVDAKAKDKLKGMEFYETPSSKAYETVYTGPYSGMAQPHEAMDAKMKADGVSLNTVVIEEYVSDPSTQPDSTKLTTNIIYLVK